jgi:uncharacterized protein (DUF58 family)
MGATTAIRAQTADLDLVIRHVLAGLGHGIHAGRERGAGVEFSEYRAYAPGDEWRRVDWKLMARADRYYVREAERDSHVAVWLLLDASASMAEPSRRLAGIDKLGCARTVLACLAAIAQRQGDAFGLVVAGDGRMRYTPASRGPRQMHRVLAQLQGVQAGGRMPDASALRASLHFARAPSLVLAVSDGLEWPSPLSVALLRLRAMHHDVRLLCLQTEAEAEGRFAAGHGYRDPEAAAASPGLHRYDSAARVGYLAARGAHFETVRRACKQRDLPLHTATIEAGVGGILRAWLRRPGRAGGATGS